MPGAIHGLYFAVSCHGHVENEQFVNSRVSLPLLLAMHYSDRFWQNLRRKTPLNDDVVPLHLGDDPSQSCEHSRSHIGLGFWSYM